MIPRSLQSSLGKTHFVKSLRTKNLNDARRLLKIAGWEYEEFLRGAGRGSSAAESCGPAKATVASVSVERAGKTFQEVFELFLNDPTRRRTKKTIAGYREGIEVIYSVIGRDMAIADIDREACRRLLDTLQWLPTNSPKKFPTLTAAQAAKMAKQRGRKDLLGPVTINSYMIIYQESSDIS